MGESWPRSCVQNERSKVCTHDVGQCFSIQISHSVIRTKYVIIRTMAGSVAATEALTQCHAFIFMFFPFIKKKILIRMIYMEGRCNFWQYLASSVVGSCVSRSFVILCNFCRSSVPGKDSDKWKESLWFIQTDRLLSKGKKRKLWLHSLKLEK